MNQVKLTQACKSLLLLLEVITILKVNNIVGNKVEKKITIDLHLLSSSTLFPKLFFFKIEHHFQKEVFEKEVYYCQTNNLWQ